MAIRGYHAHIYFDPGERAAAEALAAAAKAHFGVPVGHFHDRPIGPHPRGSVQLSMRPDQFAAFAAWASEARGDLTIFAHGLSGNDRDDHARYVIWFGMSETLDLTIFDAA